MCGNWHFYERAVILSQGEELKIPALEFIASDLPQTTPISTFVQAERDVIMDALRAASGKIAGRGGAAERLGLRRTTLQNKMQKLGIDRAVS
jgi:formate hydrogenlyase transcriptional activator